MAGLGLLTSCNLLRPAAVPAKKLPRIGYLGLAPTHFDDGFREGLRDLGYVEGESIAIEWRWPEDGRAEQYPDLVDELLRLNLDLLVTRTTAASIAATRATSTLPIVFSTVSNPVGAGLVTNLARPEANVTGVSNSVQGILGNGFNCSKRRYRPRRASPCSRTLQNFARSPSGPSSRQEIHDAARDLGVNLREHHALGPDDFDAPFATMKAEQAEALLVLPSATVYLNARAHIVDLANRGRLPAIFEAREWAEAGGLLAYGVDLYEVSRQVATYVDKILKGTRPADLPVETPTKFDFVINLKTAQDLMVGIPQSVLAQATDVIP